jgi:GNAT superfamily N-acetyltransferase
MEAPSAIAIAVETPGTPDAVALLAAYRAELDERFPGGFDPPPNWAAAAESLVPPTGCFVVLRDAGEPLGCGAVRVLEPGVAEIKHMWLSPRLRGRGLGRSLLAALELEAERLGCPTIRLDTSPLLGEAVALYRAVGYREIPRYNENPLCAIWMERAPGTVGAAGR